MARGKGIVKRSQQRQDRQDRSERSNGRSPVACNRCRHRKTRCAGSPPLPCAACVEVDEPCVYSEAEKRVSITEREYHQLKSQSHAHSRVQSQHFQPPSQPSQSHFRAIRGSSVAESDWHTSPSAPSSVPSTAAWYSESEMPPGRDDWWYKGTGNLLLNRSGEHHSVGPAATVHLAGRLNPGSTNLAWDVRPLYDDPTSLRRPIAHSLPQLPTFEFAKRLFWVQYAYIGTIFSLIQPKQFEERLEIVYRQPHDFSHRENCLIYCQSLLVMAFGLMYSVNQWSGDEGPPGFKYFKFALRFLPDIHEEGSIFFVEVLCYVAYYMQNLNRRDAAFIYIGLALRMAISLGLHQEVSDPGISETDRNRRRRAWWSVYSLDRVLSVKSGNPITIQDEDIGITWPAALDGSTTDPWPSIVLTYYTQLSRILGRIGEEIYRKKPRSGSNLIMSVQSITNDLASWLRSIPDGLRIDFSMLDTHVNRETVSINLHFYSCLNMTARPLVFYIIQRRLDAAASGTPAGDWKDGLAPNTVAVIDSCITAARATTMIMDAAAKHNLIATYGYLDGDYIFSAALLLVMVNAAFPYNEANMRSMEVALSLLRNMADRGNTYLGSRHALLLELRAAIDPKPTVPDNVEQPVPGGGIPDTPKIHGPESPRMEVPTPHPPPVMIDDWLDPLEFPSLEDISFQIDLDDDPALWEGALDQIDIDMDTDWIESTLRR
ncbi:Proline utilization trans-activator [Penicillium rolfsii]|nr:Proline utilization trans-activator [Penicillium rolfsii]